MEFENERYDGSGCPVKLILTAENDVDSDILNAIEQWLRNGDKKEIQDAITHA